MGHHQKAASCSAIPSFQSFTSDSTQTSQTTNYYEHEAHSTLKRSILIPTKSNSQETDIPLPSFCLYSKKALLNEYALESDIIQFLYPISNTLEERLPMFVGVLQSLFTVINDLPFINDSDEEDEEEEEEDIEEEEQHPFTIIGLNTLKLVIWNNLDENDLCLVVIISSQITDNIILKNMNLLKDNILSSSITNLTANQMGDQLIPLIDYWFDAE